MTGRPYSLREMKGIVDYLTEHKAYKDVKARKMWIDYANSNLTNRTWQSLKETFLKRILPDIHNPYYKLTMEEIRSFRQGLDVTNKDKNKLEIISLSGENSDDRNESDKPSTSKPAEETSTGEAMNASKIRHDRSSIDTVLLEKCYDTVEDIQKDLESDAEKEENDKTKKDKSSSKSSRDCIMYSEPLTPMMQDLINDFATDESSDKEPQSEVIDISDTNNDQQTENPNVENNAPINVSEVVEAILETDNQDITKSPSIKNKSLKLIKSPKKITVNKNTQNDIIEVNENEDAIKADANDKASEHKKIDKTSQNTPNSTTDSLLPNNQEALASAPIVINEDKSVENSAVVEANEENVLKTIDNEDISKSLITSPNKSNTEKKQTEFTSVNEDHASPNAKSPSKAQANTNISTKVIEDNPSNKDSSQINPCLQSVSLYDEQFVTAKSSDTDVIETKTDDTVEIVENKKMPNPNKDDNIKNKPKIGIRNDMKQVRKIAINVEKEVVVLKSHSEDSDNAQPINRRPMKRLINSDKNRALANLFGFSSGTVTSPRKRQMTKRQSSHRYSNIRVTSESSEWTSESDDEYVSPPRGRKNKHSKKYLKPHSARVLSLEEEGGLFLMHGKKIYPVIKDGKILKHYLSYLPESDLEEDKSYWKTKYDEEKKKTEELTKLLDNAKKSIERSKSPILPMNTPHKMIDLVADKRSDEIVDCEEQVPRKKPEPKPTVAENNKTVKVKFVKKNSEVEIEGHWSQLNPVLDHIVKIYNSEPTEEFTKPKPPLQSDSSAPVSIRTSVDVENNIQDVQEKIDLIETKIFNEIEEKDKEGEITEDTELVSNVTVRKRGRPRTIPRTQSPQNTPKKSKIDEDKNGTLLTVPSPSTRASRAKKKLDESIMTEAKTRQSKAKISEVDENEVEDSTVRYKLPSPVPSEQNKRLTSNKIDPQNAKRIVSSPDTFTQNSMESTQGYQDSDISPAKITLRKKRRLSSSTTLFRERTRVNRKKTRSYSSTKDISLEDNSFKNLYVKPNNSSLKTEAYKSESYQILMGHTKKAEKPLERIDEHAQTRNNGDQSDVLKVIPNNWLNIDLSKECKENIANSSGGGSNVSLPQSPELSIVENISFNKDDVLSKIDIPTINETQCNDTTQNRAGNKFLISEVDASMPLMGQECKIKETYNNLESSPVSLPELPHESNLNVETPTVTDSLLNKIGTVDIEDTCASDSLGLGLRNLLLDSAKKISKANEKENMEIIEKNTETKNAKPKKRCSTPRKRKNNINIKKSVAPNIDTVLEERMEFCSHGSTKSCPQFGKVYNRMDIIVDKQKQAPDTEKIVKTKKAKKKDVIKVKITRPSGKDKLKQNKVQKDNSDNYDESGVFFNDNESVDLIHNHSETCLHAKECIEDSVEYITMSPKSIISVSSSSCERNFTMFNDPDRTEAICSDAQDDNALFIEKKVSEKGSFDQDSPGCDSFNSLITEDLSNDIPSEASRISKWYLLSDEDTNTGVDSANPSVGSRLDQIFPITCAVPNLSIITEISKDTDQNSRPK